MVMLRRCCDSVRTRGRAVVVGRVVDVRAIGWTEELVSSFLEMANDLGRHLDTAPAAARAVEHHPNERQA